MEIFKFNEKKSKVTVIAGRHRMEKRKWWLGNKEMEETEEFKYLRWCGWMQN